MRTSRARSIGAGLLVVAGAFFIGFGAPIPTAPDAAERQVLDTVRERMPGWEVERIGRSWEGGYTVVVTCAARRVDFQFVPGHGLPRTSAWVRPADEVGFETLRRVSDDHRYLVWHDEPRRTRAVACRPQFARPQVESEARVVTTD
jgi:hypothetical protein